MLKRSWDWIKAFMGAIKLVVLLPIGLVGLYGIKDINQFMEDNGLELTKEGFQQIEA